MSGYASKAQVVQVVKATIKADTAQTGLSTDPGDYNIAGIVRDAFRHRGGAYGWGVKGDAQTFVTALRTHLRKKA